MKRFHYYFVTTNLLKFYFINILLFYRNTQNILKLYTYDVDGIDWSDVVHIRRDHQQMMDRKV